MTDAHESPFVDEEIREVAHLLADVLRTTRERWCLRLGAGRLGTHPPQEVRALVERLDAAARLLEQGDGSLPPIEREPLEQGEERYRLIVDLVRDYAIIMLDPEGRVVSWNAGAERIEQWRAEEIIGRSFESFYTQEDLAADAPRHELEVAMAEGRFEGRGERMRKDGTRFFAHVVLTALRDADGRLRGFAKITRDATEQRASEEALRQSEERLSLLVQQVKEYAILFIDPRGRVASWNEGAERIKGYTAEEILGQPTDVFYTPEDRAAGKPARLLAAAREHGATHDEGWRVRSDGVRFWADVSITALHDRAGHPYGFAKVVRDMTELRALQESRDTVVRQAEALRLRDDFLSIAAHELRTPLTSASLQAEALLRLFASEAVDPARAAQGAQRIVRSVSRLSGLVDSFLDFTRVVEGRVVLHRVDLDLVDVAREAADRMSEQLDRAGCVVTVVGDDPVTGCWDPLRIDQVVTNLLSNAAKYAPGAPVEVRVGGDAEHAQLEIRDHGPGITATDQERVFGRFERAAPARSYAGLGLGLYITRELVEAHGGEITVESRLGEGSVFRVKLPRRAPQEAPVAAEASPPAPASAD